MRSFADYDDPVVQTEVNHRREFFHAKRDDLYQIDIFYCVLLRSSQAKTGIGPALSRLAENPAGAFREVKAQFSSGGMQTLTTIFGGSYLNVGRESRDFSINPFSLPRTEENLQFLFAFFRTLIEGNDARYRLDFREERKLWDGIERIYVLEPDQRTVSNFADILGELKDRLHRWTRAGQYGFLFDNPEDTTLSFSRFQTFNFAGSRSSATR